LRYQAAESTGRARVDGVQHRAFCVLKSTVLGEPAESDRPAESVVARPRILGDRSCDTLGHFVTLPPGKVSHSKPL
jgi:hypothetical protein